MAELRLFMWLGAALAFFGLGFGAKQLQANAQLSTVRAEHAQEKSAAYRTALAAQQQLDAERGRKVEAVAAIDTEQTKLLGKDREDLERLRACVAAGTCGVRIVGAKCPASAGSVPTIASGAGMGVGASPELDADARQTYFTLREGIAVKERQLAACQQYVQEVSK